MIALSPPVRILVAIEPADFRKGIDGLAAIARKALESDPFSGTVFVFRNRRQTAIKILAYDGQGFLLCYKRLSSGRFCFWPRPDGRPSAGIEPQQLHVLIQGGDYEAAKGAPPWRPIGAGS